MVVKRPTNEFFANPPLSIRASRALENESWPTNYDSFYDAIVYEIPLKPLDAN